MILLLAAAARRCCSPLLLAAATVRRCCSLLLLAAAALMLLLAAALALLLCTAAARLHCTGCTAALHELSLSMATRMAAATHGSRYMYLTSLLELSVFDSAEPNAPPLEVRKQTKKAPR